MYKVLLFAGTAEGRKIAEYLKELGVPAFASAATEYGQSLLREGGSLTVSGKRMDEGEMEKFFAGEDALVIDATHPYAREVSENIRRACEKTGVPMLRILRDEENGQLKELKKDNEDQAGSFFADSLSQAVEFLKTREGRILAATGSKKLAAFCALPDWKERVFARVLPLPEVVDACSRMGFSGSHLIAMQGPFSKELNIAMLKDTDADYFVTKESGKAGGFEEKLEAAKETGVTLVVIGRPAETGHSVEETKKYLQNILNTEGKGV